MSAVDYVLAALTAAVSLALTLILCRGAALGDHEPDLAIPEEPQS
ncbi:hypothetical protein [Kitasatospora sp. NPDC004272]